MGGTYLPLHLSAIHKGNFGLPSEIFSESVFLLQSLCFSYLFPIRWTFRHGLQKNNLLYVVTDRTFFLFFLPYLLIDKRASLDLRLSLSSGLPSEFAYEDEHYVISASGSRADLLNIAVNLYEGELRYFFADHKNYYYLPMEDRAIHKSVGAFVERSARRQATKETCYERKQGLFLPEPEIIFAPVYKSAFRSEQQYALFDRQILTNECKLLEYASAVIRYAAAKINTKTREKMV